MVIGISQFLSTWWWALLALIALAVVGFVRALRNPAFKLRFDAALLRLPFVGKLIRDVHAASLARTLATMIEARLPLVDGLRLSTRTVSNAVQAQSLAQISEKVRAGGRTQRPPRRLPRRAAAPHAVPAWFAPARPSEPILFPKLRIYFADFPYLHYSIN